MNIDVSRISVLGLEKNKEKIEQKFNSFFPNRKIDYFITKGVGTTQNDGTTTSSFWNILNHNTIDKISIDIFNNHISIIKNAWEDETIDTILILEDDAVFRNWNQEKWNKVEYWLKEHKDSWDIFYLGYCNWPKLWSVFLTSSIIKVKSPLTAHGYILNRRGMFKILKTLEKNPHCSKMHIDKFFIKIPRFEKLSIFPMVCYQEKCPGLYLKACDKMNVRVLFSTCCQWNEWISILIPILTLFFICFLIIFLFQKMKKKYLI